MSHKPKRKFYQEPLFEELRRDTCYVCYERIKTGDGIYIGQNLWRHEKCKPGGHNWQKSKYGDAAKTKEV
jgi:hypothetical protein